MQDFVQMEMTKVEINVKQGRFQTASCYCKMKMLSIYWQLLQELTGNEKMLFRILSLFSMSIRWTNKGQLERVLPNYFPLDTLF